MFSRILGTGEVARPLPSVQAARRPGNGESRHPPRPGGRASFYLGVNTRVLVWWAVVGGALSAGCHSDASVICGKLYACHLLKDEAPTKDNPQGFTEDVCKSQVESELGD